MSVGTVVHREKTRHCSEVSFLREWLGRPMLFLIYPTTIHPHVLPDLRSVWIQPNIARETLPLYHHSRKSTVTEYPEAPGW